MQKCSLVSSATAYFKALFPCHLLAPHPPRLLKPPPFIRIPAELKPLKKVYHDPTAYKRQLKMSYVEQDWK